MRHRQALLVLPVGLLNRHGEAGVVDGDLGRPSQELNEAVHFMLSELGYDFPQPLNAGAVLGVPLLVLGLFLQLDVCIITYLQSLTSSPRIFCISSSGWKMDAYRWLTKEKNPALSSSSSHSLPALK